MPPLLEETMRKHWSEQWRHDVEREFGASIAEIVRGFVSDGETLESTAEILEVRTRDLKTWCGKNAIEFRKEAKGTIGHPSATRARSVRHARRAAARISFARLADWYDQDRRTIRQRFARTGNILEALR